jgi:hypothetical protein
VLQKQLQIFIALFLSSPAVNIFTVHTQAVGAEEEEKLKSLFELQSK